MSGTQTADQPSLHPSNILAHPGSTAAGGAALVTLGTYVANNPWPGTLQGWSAYVLGAALAVAAALGK